MENTKLTLSINPQIVALAKIHAKKHNTSLSRLIERYLHRLGQTKQDTTNTPIVNSLTGSIPYDPDFDYKKEVTENLEEKYIK